MGSHGTVASSRLLQLLLCLLRNLRVGEGGRVKEMEREGEERWDGEHINRRHVCLSKSSVTVESC